MVADCIANRFFWLAVEVELLGGEDGGRIMAVFAPALRAGEYYRGEPLPEEEYR